MWAEDRTLEEAPGSLSSRDDERPAGVSAAPFCRGAGLTASRTPPHRSFKGGGWRRRWWWCAVQPQAPRVGPGAPRPGGHVVTSSPTRNMNSGRTRSLMCTAHSARGVRPELAPSSSARITGPGPLGTRPLPKAASPNTVRGSLPPSPPRTQLEEYNPGYPLLSAALPNSELRPHPHTQALSLISFL